MRYNEVNDKSEVTGGEMNTPTLETERLILRKFTENDIEAIYQIYSNEEVNKFLPWFPLRSIEEARLFFEERYASKYAQPQAYAYAVCLKKDNIPIGYVNVDMEEHHDFGYGLRKEFWHQGIMYQLNFDERKDRVYKKYWDNSNIHFVETDI